jgi:hypothetical protein
MSSSSMGSPGPGFVSIPPNINNICSTNNKKNMCITLLVNLESTVGLLGKLGADLSTLVIFVVFFRHFFFVYTFCFFTKCTIVHNDEMQPFENGLIIFYDAYFLFSYCITILLCFGHSHYLSLQSGVT